jgi:hypothetical protein
MDGDGLRRELVLEVLFWFTPFSMPNCKHSRNPLFQKEEKLASILKNQRTRSLAFIALIALSLLYTVIFLLVFIFSFEVTVYISKSDYV